MKSFTVFYIAALFVLVVCAIVVERRERKKPPTVEFGPRVINDVVIERPPCKLQMDKTKPNYSDCGAFTPIVGIQLSNGENRMPIKCIAGMLVKVRLTPLRFDQPLIHGYALVTKVHDEKLGMPEPVRK